MSSEGFQQGDPTASIGFCLAIHFVIENIKSRFKKGYMDDISFADHWTIALQDLISVETESKKVGLSLNIAKCELTILGEQDDTILDEFRRHFPDIKIVAQTELTLLGSALGQAALHQELENKANSVKLMCERLNGLPIQTAFFLLKHCFLIPKFMYLLRTSPDFSHTEALEQIAFTTISNTLETVLNVKSDSKVWSQLTLPTKLGGFGIDIPSVIACASFACSYFSVCELYGDLLVGEEPFTNEAVTKWKIAACIQELPDSTWQKKWVLPIQRTRQASLLAISDEIERCRILGCAAKSSGAWLDCLPSSVLGLDMSDKEFSVACCLRLGAPVTSIYECICGTVCDTDGQHALICQKIKARFERHNSANRVIAEALKSAGFPCTLEPTGLMRRDGRRPDGVTLTNWTRGRPLCWDVTCVSRLATSHRAEAKFEGSKVAEKAEIRKRNYYADLPPTVLFQPIAIETTGGIGEDSFSFLKDLGTKICEATGEMRSFSFLQQRLSLVIQKGNSRCVLESLS